MKGTAIYQRKSVQNGPHMTMGKTRTGKKGTNQNFTKRLKDLFNPNAAGG